jgi:hypothetical protein
MLHSFLWGHPTSEHGSLASRAGKNRSAHVRSKSNGGGDDDSAAAGSTTVADMQALEAQDDNEAQLRLVRSMLTSDQLDSIEAVLTAGCVAFKGVPMAHIYVARFHAAYASNKHLQLTRLLRAARLQPGIDVLFFMQEARERSADEASGAVGGRANAVSRVTFEVCPPVLPLLQSISSCPSQPDTEPL